MLAHGMGRSYGDSNLIGGGTSLQSTDHDRFLSFDSQSGILRAQSGLTLDALLRAVVPQGWFSPVVPGTKYVTLGGMVANDVHGKNHHVAGSFGAHVRKIRLVRSDRPDGVTISPTRHKDLFRRTVGGLGLSGLIDWIEVRLKPIRSAFLDVENVPYNDLDAFLQLSDESDNWPYTVAWIDCFAPESRLGRGIFSRGRFTDYGALRPHEPPGVKTLPFSLPGFALNRLSIAAFNRLYRWRPGARFHGRAHYDPFFFPLDGINNWNRLYGRKGFYQHQSLIPTSAARAGVEALLRAIRKSGQGSFLAVLKKHGAEPSPGLLSFCRRGPGLSLALDFGNKGQRTLDLLDTLDAIVLDHGGATYPAKDGRMSPETFQAAYPEWTEIEANRDPAFQSDFWRRVSQTVSPAA